MIVVVITGGIAVGKSFCLNVFKERGFICISADEIAHEISDTIEARKQIEVAFGENLYYDGKLDRKKLGEIVFADEASLQKLNSIMHKLVYDRIFELIKLYSASEQLIAIEIPLLYETNMKHIADYVINCWVPQDVQIDRLMSRNKLTYSDAMARISSQMPSENKKALANFNVDCRMNYVDTRKAINDIIDKILKKETNE